MRKRYVWIVLLIISAFTLTFAPNIFAVLDLPQISTACESKAGLLMAVGDGYSIFKSCPAGSRRVVIIGEKGDKGDTGLQGPQGEQGLKGDKGDQGIQGLNGDIGPSGLQGPKGDTGLQGEKGLTGDKGDKGDKGDIGTPGGIRVFDNNGAELGIFTAYNQIYYPGLNVTINYETSNGNIIAGEGGDIRFQSTDCTGDAYSTISINSYPSSVNKLQTIGPTKFYIINRGPSETLSFKSSMRYDGGVYKCVGDSTTGNAYKVTQVTLSFSTPIVVPVRYQYP